MTAPEPTTPRVNPPTSVAPESHSDDAFFHELDESCPCGPTVEPVKRDDGSVGWVLIHHSLDGRERDEAQPAEHRDAVATTGEGQ